MFVITSEATTGGSYSCAYISGNRCWYEEMGESFLNAFWESPVTAECVALLLIAAFCLPDLS
jgi:hypothetical protein